MEDIFKTATYKQCHISAMLAVEASHLRSQRIAWAAETMEAAAKHINALERMLQQAGALRN